MAKNQAKETKNMKQSQRYHIQGRVFTIVDLKRIAGVFAEQARLAKQSDSYYRISYTIYFSDNSTIEYETPGLFESDAVQIKRPIKVEFYFHNAKSGRLISFDVAHGQEEYGNNFKVTTNNDEKWLNDNFTKLEKFVTGAKPSLLNWLTKHRYMLSIPLALGIGISVMSLFGLLFDFLWPTQQKEFLGDLYAYRVWLYLWIAFLIGTFGGGISLTNWILSAWPNIDLDFGADHLKVEKKRRGKIVWVATIIVIPIVLMIGLDIFKAIQK